MCVACLLTLVISTGTSTGPSDAVLTTCFFEVCVKIYWCAMMPGCVPAQCELGAVVDVAIA